MTGARRRRYCDSAGYRLIIMNTRGLAFDVCNDFEESAPAEDTDFA